ncbi:uncharacterized protein LOC111374445 [Olea europaea var. sylvestris]|uniref:uncharacterized protein LOC111374445 n=1 Tax=Olea europaea var. sylvestris TaxID=158386 RepID=UPI000C1D6598|nr:uncharacterized protein LOC111374445 [Olea europaea var. sylvestris]
MVTYMGLLKRKRAFGKFSRKLKEATENSDFYYYPKCGPLKITRLAFAEDLMLYARADGLKMSTAKSNLYTIEIHGATVREHLKVSKYTEGSIPFRYLGIPLAAIKLKVSSYAPFMDKISVSVCSWTSSSVSYAGRAKHNFVLLTKSLWNIHKKKDSLDQSCLLERDNNLGLSIKKRQGTRRLELGMFGIIALFLNIHSSCG